MRKRFTVSEWRQSKRLSASALRELVKMIFPGFLLLVMAMAVLGSATHKALTTQIAY